MQWLSSPTWSSALQADEAQAAAPCGQQQQARVHGSLGLEIHTLTAQKVCHTLTALIKTMSPIGSGAQRVDSDPPQAGPC